MKSKDTTPQKIMKVLEELKLRPDQMDIIEDYLMGEAGEEALELLTYKDLYPINPHNMRSIMYKLVDNESDEARKLFNILFAVGNTTCHPLIPAYGPPKCSALCTKETLHKYIAVYANDIATNPYSLSHSYIKAFEQFDIDLEGLRKAMDCQRDINSGKVFLYAMYFKRKYIDNGLQTQIEKDDQPLLDAYENTMINSLDRLFDPKMPKPIMSDIKKAMREDNIYRIRPLVRQYAIYKKFRMQFFGGLSYLSFSVSQVLKNIVSLCFEINSVEMLDILSDMTFSLNVGILKIGGDFDKLFGIDARTYILWLARKCSSYYNDGSVLQRQFQTNRDIFINIIKEGIDDKEGLKTVNHMLGVVEQNDPALYQKIDSDRKKDNGSRDMENIIDWILSAYFSNFGANNPDLTDDNRAKLKEYIMGRETLDAIYPFADHLRIKKLYSGHNEQIRVQTFRKTYGDGEFTRRCAVVALFIGAGNYLRWEMADEGRNNISPQKVEKLFDDFEKEGLSLKYRLSLLDAIDETLDSMESKQEITEISRQIFAKYLKERRAETLAVFSSASALGRLFGLTVMACTPDENKTEILAYAQDNSKPVKEYLLEILCAQKSWEDDIKTLLSSKKVYERELGVRVLIHWQSEGAGVGVDANVDYTDLFASMIKNEKNAKVTALLQNAIKTDIKGAAGAALDFAASQLGITKEELADRIVPNLGFDENMERIFDYGERKFKVTITTALELEVFDESGKKLKNLPAVGKKDDPEKASAAYEEFKQMKKQMKATVNSQKSRLEYELSVKREWSVDAWKNLFVKNPIMHQFAIGLIWGIYEDGKLTQSFRYMEDGSFNTEDGEEFTLPKSEQAGRTQIGQVQIGRVRIGLVHPTELTEVSFCNWRQQLEDYEIKQPIDQLNRPVYVLTDDEKEQKSLERFGGCILNDLSLNGKLLGKGWYRGSVQDGGSFCTYYREDIEAGLGVELHFSGSFVGGYNGGEDVTVYEARFYKAGTIKRESYCYDEADDNKSIVLKEIPPRYFSEIVLQLAAATASSLKRNDNWRKDAY